MPITKTKYVATKSKGWARKHSTRGLTVERLPKMIIKKINGCWEWNGKGRNHSGYAKILFEGVFTCAHRAVWRLIFGDVPSNLLVLHKCDNRVCVNPEHLYIGTPKDNANDMVNRGRSMIGIKNHKAKLTEEQVKEIRHSYKLGQSYKLARVYGVNASTIQRIIRNETWCQNANY